MTRRLATLAAAASLLLCIATVALWVRSYLVSDIVIRRTRVSSTLLCSGRGWICLYHNTARAPDAEGVTYIRGKSFAVSHWLPNETFIPLIQYARSRQSLYLAVPNWLVSIVTVLPATLGFTLVGGRRKPKGCPTCGYDLRATPARCPECGAVPAEAAAR